MKNLKLILFLLLFSATMSGCVKESTACFTWDDSKYLSKVTFDASCSKNAETYRWSVISNNSGDVYNYGDQSSVTQTYAFLRPSTYTIQLEVTNKDEGHDIITHDITR